jgi:3-oxoacyl-[acyl-carrier-protein] synthase-3
MSSRIIGCGSYLPSYILTNEELTKSIDSTVEWIKTRTGIDERRIAKDQSNLDMAYHASLLALENSGLQSHEIDLIIVATTSSDQIFPSLAVRLQGLLGLNNIPAFDIQAVCSGFIYGLHLADSLIKSKQYKNILLIGSEKMSQIIDWTDRSTCILFGDGAGALIIQSQDNQYGIIDSQIFSDGSKHDILFSEYISNDQLDRKNYGTITMNGREVFKLAVNYMKSSIDNILQKNNLDISKIDLLIPHQANIRIIDALAEKLAMDDKKIVKTINIHSNCSAASIPLAIDHALKNNQLKSGDLVVLVAFGGGLTWGTCLLKW